MSTKTQPKNSNSTKKSGIHSFYCFYAEGANFKTFSYNLFRGRISFCGGIPLAATRARVRTLSTARLFKAEVLEPQGTCDLLVLFRALYLVLVLEMFSRKCGLGYVDKLDPFQLPQRPSNLGSVDAVCFEQTVVQTSW